MQTITKLGLAAAFAVATGFAAPALADDDKAITGGDNAFKTYGAFSKLEANVAEAALNVLLHATAPAATRTKLMTDYNDDLESVRVYVNQLEGLRLTGNAATALTEFKSGWGQFEQRAKDIMGKATVAPDELVAFYDLANEVDEGIDAVLITLQGQIGRPAATN